MFLQGEEVFSLSSDHFALEFMYKQLGIIGSEWGEFADIDSVSLCKHCGHNTEPDTYNEQTIRNAFCHTLLHGILEIHVTNKVCLNCPRDIPYVFIENSLLFPNKKHCFT